MIDVVLPLAKSRIDHLDLRFCLRSLERHVKNIRNIWIVGEPPSWIKNVNVIGFSDAIHLKWKEKNIMNKVQAACMNSSISDDFFFINDDYVFLKDIDATNYPYYYRGTCQEAYDNNAGNPYRITTYHTLEFLKNRNFPDLCYDGHCPIVYNKKKFMQTFQIKDINFETPYGYMIKTLYCATNRVKGEYMEDCKFQRSYPREHLLKEMENRSVISHNEGPIKTDLGIILKEMFPKKSSYEK